MSVSHRLVICGSLWLLQIIDHKPLKNHDILLKLVQKLLIIYGNKDRKLHESLMIGKSEQMIMTPVVITDQTRILKLYGKSWDLRAPIIWDYFAIFRKIATPRRHISARIHSHVVGSSENVVMLLDQMTRIARFSCGFFTAMTGNKNQGAYMQFYAPN